MFSTKPKMPRSHMKIDTMNDKMTFWLSFLLLLFVPALGREMSIVSDCCEPHGSGGCEPAACESLVCSELPYCCEETFYPECAELAFSICPAGSCQESEEGDESEGGNERGVEWEGGVICSVECDGGGGCGGEDVGEGDGDGDGDEDEDEDEEEKKCKGGCQFNASLLVTFDKDGNIVDILPLYLFHSSSPDCTHKFGLVVHWHDNKKIPNDPRRPSMGHTYTMIDIATVIQTRCMCTPVDNKKEIVVYFQMKLDPKTGKPEVEHYASNQTETNVAGGGKKVRYTWTVADDCENQHAPSHPTLDKLINQRKSIFRDYLKDRAKKDGKKEKEDGKDKKKKDDEKKKDDRKA